MDSVVDWIQSMDKDTVLRFLSAFARHTDPDIAAEGQQVLVGFTAVWKTDQRQISSVYLVARQMIRPWQEPAVARSAAHTAIDLSWLLGENPSRNAADGWNSLFLCADLDEADRLAPVLGGLVDDLIRDVYAQVARTGQALDPPLGVSDAPTRLEILPSALLRQVAPGQALLIHNTLPPAHLYGRYWFRDPQLRALATGEPLDADHARSSWRTYLRHPVARVAGWFRWSRP